MKFTVVFTTLLCASTIWAVQPKNTQEPKDKREAAIGYGSPPSHSYHAPASYSHGDANAISIGAGYSIGGAKPTTYSNIYSDHGSSGGLQGSSQGLSPSGHATIQLAPITLQPGQQFASGDLSQIMSQLSHSLNAGGLSLQPSNAIAEFHQGGENLQAINQGQEYSFPQFSHGAPKYELSGVPAYSTGTKSLSSYSSTGPVLFTPSDSQSNAPATSAFNYAPAHSGNFADIGSYSLGSAGQSLGGATHALGDSAHSLGAATHSLGGAGHSLGASHQFGGSGYSLGSSGNSLAGLGGLGGAGNSYGGYKQLSSGYSAPSKSSFKPSTFIGHGEAGHGISGLSGSFASPSSGHFRGGHGGLTLGSAGHGGSFGGSFGSGSAKFAAPSFHSSKPEGLDGISALSSSHFASPPGTTYGHPTSSYSSNNIHAASSNKPYYVSAKQYRGHYRSPAPSHGSLSSYSSAPKYSFTGSNSPYEPSDAHVSASENSYNTIKYSEELKPHIN